MRNGPRLSLVVVVAFSLFWPGTVPVAAAAEPPASSLTKAEKKAGWRLLFDGTSTKGWRGFKQTGVPEAWKVVDGVLTLDGKGGDLMTEEQFGDFELAIDWKISAAGNSGLMYRVGEAEERPYLTGPEYQFLDNTGHADGKKESHRSGALYDVYAPSKDATLPVGSWNQTKIVARGKHIEHWLNGEKVVECEIGSDDWNQRVAASKWKKTPAFASLARGHVDLQDHGNKIEFRNIKIRPLAATPAKAAVAPAKSAAPIKESIAKSPK